ncbi:unnamed protein product [Cyclocybe aegerita]|uniref:L-dopachrome isomerase n=1 Tax=Cyclocybe aegerita TaxID=1973307 RepID=A0A8S0X2Q4_CYCAE|nr:unnamed protein product [Cyclocybe aegerita]
MLILTPKIERLCNRITQLRDQVVSVLEHKIMPTLNLVTNVKIPDAKAFALKFSKFGAETLGKPEAYISVIISYNETLTFAGTFDPAFSLRIDSLDNINPEANDRYTKAFAKFFEENLGAKDNRGYVTFIDPGRANIGFQSTTFATIFGGSK